MDAPANMTVGNPKNGRVIDSLSATIVERASGKRPLIVGLTGSVAAGKSTLCQALAERLRPSQTVEIIGTDGFLLPNALLNSRGLAMRKGFPESYDADGLFEALLKLRDGPTAIPGYSHVTYDVDPSLTRIINAPHIVILEGLAFAPFADGRTIADAVDLMIYLDASEEELETWFTQRFMTYWRAAEHDPASFYAQFRHMSPEEADAFGRMVWRSINLPNLRDHIVHCRERADVLLRKTTGHQLERLK